MKKEDYYGTTLKIALVLGTYTNNVGTEHETQQAAVPPVVGLIRRAKLGKNPPRSRPVGESCLL